jgi:hypothetical protein
MAVKEPGALSVSRTYHCFRVRFILTDRFQAPWPRPPLLPPSPLPSMRPLRPIPAPPLGDLSPRLRLPSPEDQELLAQVAKVVPSVLPAAVSTLYGKRGFKLTGKQSLPLPLPLPSAVSSIFGPRNIKLTCKQLVPSLPPVPLPPPEPFASPVSPPPSVLPHLTSF